jgi:hypothetical protein
MTTAKKFKIGSAIVLVLLVVAFLHYNLPRTEVVQISGTDIKRVDKTKKVKEESGDKANTGAIEQQTSDIRFINSITRNGKVMVFKNVDTGWGWPPYLKFNSADVNAEAQAFATNPKKPWVLVKYYGWRMTVFSMFPNVLKLKEVDQDYSHIPIFNIIFFILLFALILFVRKKVKQFNSWMRGRGKTQKE